MKLIISYLILSGMFLMFIPKTFFHECSKTHLHHSDLEKHHDDDRHSEDSNSSSFKEYCKFCAIDFDVLGLPNYKISKSITKFYAKPNSIQRAAAYIDYQGASFLRGPPVFITL